MPGWEHWADRRCHRIGGSGGHSCLMERRRSCACGRDLDRSTTRTLSEHGDRHQRRAEELERREQRVEKLAHSRALDAGTATVSWPRGEPTRPSSWTIPPGAVTEADRLVQDVMKARGYPVADFDQRVEDISSDHPHLVQNYRARGRWRRGTPRRSQHGRLAEGLGVLPRPFR